MKSSLWMMPISRISSAKAITSRVRGRLAPPLAHDTFVPKDADRAKSGVRVRRLFSKTKVRVMIDWNTGVMTHGE